MENLDKPNGEILMLVRIKSETNFFNINHGMDVLKRCKEELNNPPRILMLNGKYYLFVHKSAQTLPSHLQKESLYDGTYEKWLLGRISEMRRRFVGVARVLCLKVETEIQNGEEQVIPALVNLQKYFKGEGGEVHFYDDVYPSDQERSLCLYNEELHLVEAIRVNDDSFHVPYILKDLQPLQKRGYTTKKFDLNK